ncbi:hypothetical protein SCLCIDRAFT_1220736 [Scleroderma citrinum Foug A]|uniref:Uncharacterized protein n=1 Tax=Scleroderma citrinum Foug A TaxID=1036808 RepID=A0A0C3DIL5_9AGAM|nr:hypothetical protein SCLCIDRAFT_1220736 [Scleroderma citrinum Foug A]
MANIHAVARFPSTAAKDIWSVSTAFRRVKKHMRTKHLRFKRLPGAPVKTVVRECL